MSFVLLFRRIEGQETSPNPPIASWLVSVYSAGGLEPSVAQPPLPLQEFLPLQPLSPSLQPPLPLQEFWPLQACFSFLCLAFSDSWSCSLTCFRSSRLHSVFTELCYADSCLKMIVPAYNPANSSP